MRKLLLYFPFILVFICCSSDENKDEIKISVEDFEVTINEGVEDQELLGALQANTNQGSVTYGLIGQSPENAFTLDVSTGELRVENKSLFNYELYTTITGVAEVSNGEVSKMIDIVINILDVEENNLLIRTVDPRLISGESYFISDQKNELNFENGEIVSWIHSSSTTRHIKNFVSNNGLIVEITDDLTAEGGYCYSLETITYDENERIINISSTLSGNCQYTRNYSMEYEGNQVNFIDQNGNDHKTALFNDNGQIIQFTTGSDIVQFEYEGENLIKKTRGNRSLIFEYDGYRNPFKIEETLNFPEIATYLNVMWGNTSYHSDDSNFMNNSNNIIRFVLTNSGNPTLDYDFEYHYNSDDYPISKKVENFGNIVAEYGYD